MASGETRDSREASGRPGPAAAVAAALGRFPPPTGWRVLAALALVSLACGLIAARISLDPAVRLWQLDLPKIDWPLAVFFHRALGEGRLPLWDDTLGLGFPLYAEGQVGAFYPPNWLLYRLPPLTALDAVRVLHLAFAGTGAGLLVLRISGSRTGAVLAAIVAALGGGIVAKLEWTNVVEAYGWIPWVLLPLVRRPGPTRCGIVAGGILWGVQALAGHPNVWLLTGLAAAVLLVAQTRGPRGVADAVVFGLLGGAVGSIQLLPTLLLTTLSVRSAGVSADDLFASAATIFDPLLLGFGAAFAPLGTHGWAYHSAWYPDGIFPLLEADAYVSLAVVALFALGAVTRRVRPLLVAAAVLVAIAVVAALRPVVWQDIPILNGLRSPVRAYLVVSVVVGVVAGVGVGRLGRTGRGAGFAVALVAGLLGAYAAAAFLALWAPSTFTAILGAFSVDLGPDTALERLGYARASLTAPYPFLMEAALGILSVAVVAWAARRRPVGGRRLFAAWLVVVAAFVPLALLSPQANTVRPTQEIDRSDTQFVRMLVAAAAHRLLTLGEPGWYEGMPDQLAAAGVPDIRMFSSLDLQASEDLLRVLRDAPDAEAIRRLVGIDVIAAFGDHACPGETIGTLATLDVTVCRVPAATPPWWIPGSAVTPDAAPGTITKPQEATIDHAAALAGLREATVTAWGADSGAFTVDAPRDGYVWIDRAWWPAWRTEVDGQGVTALRALGGQLIPVTAGHHEIQQALVPWEVLIGLLAAVVAIALGVAWCLLGRRRRRDGAAPGDTGTTPA